MADATGVTETPEAEARRLLLRAADIPCPRCRYNLRGVTSPACPECGEPLVLTLARTSPTRRVRSLLLVVCAWILALNGVAAWTQYNFVARYYDATTSQAERSVQRARLRADDLEMRHQQLLDQPTDDPSLLHEVEVELDRAKVNLAEATATRDGFPKTMLGYFRLWGPMQWMSLFAAIGVVSGGVGLMMIAVVRRRRSLSMAVLLGMVLPAIAFSIVLVYYARMVWQM